MPEPIELLTPETLAERLQVSARFVKENSRPSRTLDPIPHVLLHRRARLYAWNSPEMNEWLKRRGVTRRKA